MAQVVACWRHNGYLCTYVPMYTLARRPPQLSQIHVLALLHQKRQNVKLSRFHISVIDAIRVVHEPGVRDTQRPPVIESRKDVIRGWAPFFKVLLYNRGTCFTIIAYRTGRIQFATD